MEERSEFVRDEEDIKKRFCLRQKRFFLKGSDEWSAACP
jgi:hypothetical protein